MPVVAKQINYATINVDGVPIPLEGMEDEDDDLHSRDLTYSMLESNMDTAEEISNQDLLYKNMALF